MVYWYYRFQRNDMSEEAKRDKAFLIADNRRAIKNPKTKEVLRENPSLVEKDRDLSVREIKLKLPVLEQYFNELLPFVKELRSQIADITEETHICAVYLLLAHACQDWNSLFNLARIGDYGSFSFIRLIKESIAQSDLIVLDSRTNERKNIDKWFKGEIIGHEACRTAQDNFMQASGLPSGVIKDMAKRIYHMESLSIHGSYVSMLESVSPFTEDFDYGGRTQYFRTSKSLDYAKGTMDAMSISLKLVYLYLVKDEKKYDELDKILNKYTNM